MPKSLTNGRKLLLSECNNVNKLKDYFNRLPKYSSDLSSIIVYDRRGLAYTKKELTHLRYLEFEKKRQKNINIFIDWLIKLAIDKKLHLLNNCLKIDKRQKKDIDNLVNLIMKINICKKNSNKINLANVIKHIYFIKKLL